MNFIKLSLFFLSGIIMLSSCSDDDNTNNGNGGSKPKETTLTGYTLLGNDETEQIPITIDGVNWTYGADNKMNTLKSYMVSYNVKYSDNKIEMIDTRIKTEIENGIEVEKEISDTVAIYLQEGRIVKRTITNHYYDSYFVEYKYYYNEDGFLVKITDLSINGDERDFCKMTIENGNVVKLIHMEHSLWSTEPFSTETYTYTYDSNDYMPMSDWGPFTPMYFAGSQIFALSDSLLGKKSKNNIVRLDIAYTAEQFSPRFNYITFEPEFDKDDKLIRINHTGQYVGWVSEGSPIVNFTKAGTIFRYTEK